jgi:hypothetical protein
MVIRANSCGDMKSARIVRVQDLRSIMAGRRISLNDRVTGCFNQTKMDLAGFEPEWPHLPVYVIRQASPHFRE